MAALGLVTRASPKPLRVVQWGVGNTGVVALQAILDAPGLELVGVWARNPGLSGEDAGHLAGADRPIGVTVADDRESLLAAAPDCVSYMATDRGCRNIGGRHQEDNWTVSPHLHARQAGG